MHRTPWTNQNSSLPSDRIRPVSKPPNNQKNKGKGKQQQPIETPKSKEVRTLESLLQGVHDATGKEKDPKGGCFCMARNHALSLYSPICLSCGLILCAVNLPQYCCPHCGKVLMTGTLKESLINQLDSQLASTITKELEDKERAIEEARKAVGAFPSLSGSSSPSLLSSPSPHPAVTPPSRQTHKVMSLTQNKKVVVSSYTSTPVSSRPVSRNEDIAEEPIRVPPPPPAPKHAHDRPTRERPWENLIKGGVTYVPRQRLDDDGETPKPQSSRRKRGNNKDKGKENDGRE
ncbi:hypothetical protein B0H34DRAFT_705881 [Crassisporium funariophilum]|nr:hypothetical protein B0H34DRAFT_705881 [Crassisporium funariophilum]